MNQERLGDALAFPRANARSSPVPALRALQDAKPRMIDAAFEVTAKQLKKRGTREERARKAAGGMMNLKSVFSTPGRAQRRPILVPPLVPPPPVSTRHLETSRDG